MNNNISVSRTVFLSNDKMRDCYYIISASNGLLADDFYRSAEHDVNHNGHILFTAQTERMVVGVLKGRVLNMPDTVLSEIEYCYVDKKYQRRGIGRALLKAYEDYVQEQYNAQRIVLHSAPAKRALDFYQKLGYQIAGAQYLMSKNLGK